jgi:F0F1-type ATP synthase delta subunit
MESLIVMLFVLSVAILIYMNSDEYSELRFFSAVLITVFLIVFTVYSLGLLQAGKTAQYLNKTYNTEYTTQDIFWNEKLIKSRLKIEDKIIDDSSKIKLEVINK